MGDFAKDTEPQGAQGRYSAELSRDWEIWGPNGGYLAAIALRAAGCEAAIARPASFAAHYLRVPAFIATLTMLFIGRGLVLGLTGGQNIGFAAKQDDPLFVLGVNNALGFNNQVVLFAVVAVIGGFVLARTRWGYETYAVGGNALAAGGLRPEDAARLEPWARLWHAWVSAAFVRSYLEAAGPAPFLPRDRADLGLLLDFYLLKRCVNELRAELTTRPARAAVPLRGLRQLLQPKE